MSAAIARLREAYRAGARKPSDSMEAALGRLGGQDQSAVWISTVDPEKAMAAARVLDQRLGEIDRLPLYGLVFSVKDNIHVAGEPTTAACPGFEHVPEASAPVVAAALEAGALYLGKTNMDQFATGLVGVRSPYGTPRNPHNPAYIPGGSSSGAGVSVATGTVHFAFGTDTGGSGRVPACYGGVVGLKPAPGMLSRRGLIYACRSFDTASIFAADAEDARLVYDAIVAPDALDPYALPPEARRPWRAETKALGALRLAIPRPEDLDFFGDAETEALFAAARRRLEGLVGAIEETDYRPFDEVGRMVFFDAPLAERDAAVGDFIDRRPDDCHPVVRELILGSRRFNAADAHRALYKIAETRTALAPFWERTDALMLPTVGSLLTVAEVTADPLTPNFNNGYYTNPANPLGLAAVATPFGRNAAGVPYGVTFLAPPGSEGFLCRLAEAFSETEEG